MIKNTARILNYLDNLKKTEAVNDDKSPKDIDRNKQMTDKFNSLGPEMSKLDEYSQFLDMVEKKINNKESINKEEIKELEKIADLKNAPPSMADRAMHLLDELNNS